MTYDQVESIIVSELALLLSDNGQQNLAVNRDTPLLAEGALIDSFDLVSLVVAIEDRLAQAGQFVEVIDEAATTGKDSPFRTVGSLAQHIQTKCSS